ncbi:MAG: hypothetical protein ABSE67_11270 [Xanthobacteraceae bacterium]|jgi:hypothetical protein
MRSPVAATIDHVREQGMMISVYLDDFIGSHDDEKLLRRAYETILTSCVEANFTANPQKLSPPSDAIVAFNCDLAKGQTKVTQARVDQFFATDRPPDSQRAFGQYRNRVAINNVVG